MDNSAPSRLWLREVRPGRSAAFSGHYVLVPGGPLPSADTFVRSAALSGRSIYYLSDFTLYRVWPLRAAALPEKSLYQDLEARRTHLADHDGLGGREGGRAVDSLLTAQHLTVRGVEQHLLTVVQSADADEALVCRHHHAPHLGGVDVGGQAAGVEGVSPLSVFTVPNFDQGSVV